MRIDRKVYRTVRPHGDILDKSGCGPGRHNARLWPSLSCNGTARHCVAKCAVGTVL
jgi:hypothetical protein